MKSLSTAGKSLGGSLKQALIFIKKPGDPFMNLRGHTDILRDVGVGAEGSSAAAACYIYNSEMLYPIKWFLMKNE